MLGGVGVDHLDALVDVVDQHDARLPTAERGADPLGVAGREDLLVELGLDVVGERRAESVTSTEAAIGSCSAWLIRSAATKAASALSSARIAISVGPGLGVDADDAAQQPLGGGDVDVARTGDEVDAVGTGPAP